MDNLKRLREVISYRHDEIAKEYYQIDDCDDLAIMLGKMEVMEEIMGDIDKLLSGKPID